MATDDLDPRVHEIRRHLDLSVGPGLEIGPLHSPIVTPDDADVRYVDVHLTPELRAYYSTHPGIPVDEIVEVDYALIEGDVSRSLPEAVAQDAPFRWVVASHVIEHVPDLVGWLRDISSVLEDDGRLSLAIPDRRYCFDALRPPTTVGQILQAYFDGDERPSVRAVFDHFSKAVELDLPAAWRGEPADPGSIIHGEEFAWKQVSRVLDTGEYQDCHVWLFTPGSFAEQLRTLAELDLLSLTPVSVGPTSQGSIEFYVTLAKVPSSLTGDARREAVIAGFDQLPSTAALDGGPSAQVAPSDQEAPTDGADGRATMDLSALEQRAVAAKRHVMGWVRSTSARIRRT